MRPFFTAILAFYLQGFRSMRLGRTLWAIILLKLFILFAVLKPFFFPDVLETRFASDAERADHVLARLVRPGEAAIPASDGPAATAAAPGTGGHPPGNRSQGKISLGKEISHNVRHHRGPQMRGIGL
ncbi:MAG: DUF4492 domain-containing protein [Desulfobacteraceae bacterium]|nr:DUF4492 domain-containing protein [Desulfobacteraceae bacterium]